MNRGLSDSTGRELITCHKDHCETWGYVVKVGVTWGRSNIWGNDNGELMRIKHRVEIGLNHRLLDSAARECVTALIGLAPGHWESWGVSWGRLGLTRRF